jgi:hypothetical protein
MDTGLHEKSRTACFRLWDKQKGYFIALIVKQSEPESDSNLYRWHETKLDETFVQEITIKIALAL